MSQLGLLSNMTMVGGLFFIFKQKTAYEMRISDWSSDVCSSDLIAGVKPAIDANVHPARGVIARDLARRGQEAARILVIDTAFHRMTPKFEVFLFDRQACAARDADLFADEVEAGDHLGHRMLDLDARVHLDDEKLALFPQELDLARAAIAHRRHR